MLPKIVDLFSGCGGLALGFVKAIRKFDINYDVRLSTYAIPYIMGEIKRFLRDDGPIKVSRSLKDLHRKIVEVQKEFIIKKGRDPSLRRTLQNFKN